MENSHYFAIRNNPDIVEARQKSASLALKIGFQAGDAALIATMVSELARNILEYAREGEIIFAEHRRGIRHGIQVVSTDRGPGIQDPSFALSGAISHRPFDRGRSLLNCKKCVDEFDIHSRRGYGTAVILRKWLAPVGIYTSAPGIIEWGVDSRPVPGAAKGIGTYVVSEFPQGALVGVVGGEGEDTAAALAESAVVSTLSTYAYEPVAHLVRRCHEAAQKTSGAVAGLASFNRTEETVTWAGVGRVGGFLLRSQHGVGVSVQRLPSSRGRIGDKIPDLKPVALPVRWGDCLTFTMDGVVPDYSKTLLDHSHEAPQTIAERILEQNKTKDEVLILVARYKGGGKWGSSFEHLARA